MESDLSWAAALVITLPVTLVLAIAGFVVREVAVRSVDGRLDRNRLAGLRTPATLSSDEAWLAGQQGAYEDSLRGGNLAIVSAVGAFAVAWLLGAIGVLGPEGTVVLWTIVLLVGVVAMSILLLRGFLRGNAAAKAVVAASG